MKDFEIRCDESHLEKNNTLYGKFTLGPFLPGQGTTFGNALRRSLLSELSGLAITAFEILGVMQEFSTLPGLRESVLDLSLNLKQVVLTGILPCSMPPIGFLKVRGPAIIYGADLKLPAGIYCASPEQYIGTLASNGVLNMKFLVSVGKGHSTQPYSLYRSLSKIKLQPTLSANSVNKLQNTPLFDGEWRSSLDSVAEMQNFSKLGVENPSSKMQRSNIASKKKTSQEHKSSNTEFYTESTNYENNANSTNLNPPGYVNIQKQTFQRVTPHQVLPIDAVFTPVSQVNFLTQVNDRFETARENIVLEIWTNGSIHPKRALEEAALSLVQNFDILLKSIQQASSFYRGLRYFNSLESLNEKKKSSENPDLSLHRSVYNLDIGNLDFSLETFILLKKAKVKTLADLLKIKNSYSNGRNTFFNEKAINEISKVVNQFGINLSL